MNARSFLLALALPLVACGGEAAAPTPPPTPPTPPPSPTAPPTEAPEPAAEEPALADACARVIVVAWSGAQAADPSITRSEDDARARAQELLTRIERGERFDELARSESDARASGPRGGLLGTYSRDEWPAVHEPIRDAIFALRTDELSEVLRAPYGWVIAQRCPNVYLHARHILVRYAGARSAGPEVTRTQDEARARAIEILARARQPGADFEALAREVSEDSSAERGGDLGRLGRGRLAEEFEARGLELAPGAISDVVQTEFGFHIIQRVE